MAIVDFGVSVTAAYHAGGLGMQGCASHGTVDPVNTTTTRWLRTIVARCQDNYRLTSILALGLLTAATIVPLGFVRLAAGQPMMALVDLGAAAMILSSAAYAWRGGSATVAGSFLVVCCSVAVVAASAWTGTGGLLWTYLVMVGNFMLADRRVALAANFVLVLVTPFVNAALADGFVLSAFLSTSVLLTVHTFVVIRWAERQRDRLREMATMDSLTGVANRRTMEVDLREAVRAHQRLQLPAAVAVLDLDHFKHINDTHGHDAGDRALVAFTTLVQGEIRKRDRLFRFGGEEFVLLLPATDADGAATALRKLCSLVRAQPLACGTPLRVSIGASLLRPADDWTTWLSRADAELYQAKRTGRDRVCLDTLSGNEPEDRRSVTV